MRCGDKFPAARPFAHCTKQVCVDAHIIERRSLMAINLIPKSGFQPVFKSDGHLLGKTTKG